MATPGAAVEAIAVRGMTGTAAARETGLAAPPSRGVTTGDAATTCAGGFGDVWPASPGAGDSAAGAGRASGATDATTGATGATTGVAGEATGAVAAGGGGLGCSTGTGAGDGAGDSSGSGSGVDAGGVDRGGNRPSGSTYPSSSAVRRIPRWTVETDCSGVPLDPIVPTVAPSATESPFATPIEPRWTSVTA